MDKRFLRWCTENDYDPQDFPPVAPSGERKEQAIGGETRGSAVIPVIPLDESSNFQKGGAP